MKHWNLIMFTYEQNNHFDEKDIIIKIMKQTNK